MGDQSRIGGSTVVVSFVLADENPDRAARFLQEQIEQVLTRTPTILGTPTILSAERNASGPLPRPISRVNRVNELHVRLEDGRIGGEADLLTAEASSLGIAAGSPIPERIILDDAYHGNRPVVYSRAREIGRGVEGWTYVDERGAKLVVFND